MRVLSREVTFNSRRWRHGAISLSVLSFLLVSGPEQRALAGDAATGAQQTTEGLVAHWRLDDASGTTAADSAGLNTASLMNGAKWTTGRHAGAILLDGATGYIAPPVIDVSGSAMTLAAWVNVASYPSSVDQRIISKSTGTAEQAHYWMLSQVNQGNRNLLRFRLKTNGSTTTLVASTGDLPVNAWYHAAAVYNGSSMILYLNGVEVGRTSKWGAVAASNTVPVDIGRSPDGSNYLNGTIDDVRVYARALSPADLADVMEGEDDSAPDTTPPSIPTSLQAVAASPTQVHVSWTPSSDDSAVTGYRVRRNGVAVTTNTTSYVDSTAQPATTYSYTVSAFDEAGNQSAESAPVTVTTPAADSTPPRITGVAASEITISEATIIWATDEPASSAVDYGTTSSYGSTDFNHVLTTSHEVRIAGLQPSTTYYYRVTSRDAAGNVSNSAGSTFTTGSVTDPGGSGLVAHWPLDEGSGTVAQDAAGNRHATLTGGATWARGKAGNAVSLNGSSAYLESPNMDVTGTKLTITAWVKHSALPANVDQRIVSKATGTAEQAHYWMLSQEKYQGQQRLRFRLKTGSTTTTLVASSGDLVVGSWYHAAATYDGSRMRIYLDGREVGSTSKSGNIATSPSVPVSIGRNPDGSNYLNGLLDDVRIYNQALTASEIGKLSEGAGAAEPETPDTTAPSVPTNLQAAAASSTEIHLQWSASSDDVSVTGYRLRRNGVVIASPLTTSYADAGLSPATAYGYTVSAVDAAGNESAESTPVAETTDADAPANQPPSVTLTSPASGASFTAPATMTVGASASDPENRLSEVQFFAGSSLIGTDRSAPYSIAWSSVPAGAYSLTAVARDADGGFTTSAPITVTVTAVTITPWRVAFTASTDHDTNVTSYRMEIFASGADPNSATPLVSNDLGKPTPNASREIVVDRTSVFEALAAGSYVLSVRAIGPGGSTRSAAISFTR